LRSDDGDKRETEMGTGGQKKREERRETPGTEETDAEKKKKGE